MTTRQRTRDPEAEIVAEKIVADLAVPQETKPFVKLGALRGYSAGKRTASADLEAMEARNARQTEEIDKLRSKAASGASGFTPGEANYIATIHHYGMEVDAIAALFGVGPDAIKGVVHDVSNPMIRYGTAGPRAERSRVLHL